MDFADFEPAYIKIDVREEVVVAAFNLTHLTDDENVEQLGHEMFSVVEQFGCRKVAVDLAGVRFVTSSVLGKLITLHRKLHRCNGQLVLCNVGKEVGDVLRTSKLSEYFSLADDIDAAEKQLNAQ